MTIQEALELANFISQTGFAVAAYRLVTKFGKAFKAHEAADAQFYSEVRARLGIVTPAAA